MYSSTLTAIRIAIRIHDTDIACDITRTMLARNDTTLIQHAVRHSTPPRAAMHKPPGQLYLTSTHLLVDTTDANDASYDCL